MRVFLDTNVVVSRYLASGGGVAAEVLSVILESADHELMTGEYVLGEVERVLEEKFRVPHKDIREYVSFYRSYHIEPVPPAPYPLPIDDPDDAWIVATAVQAGADILLTGDKPLRSVDEYIPELLVRTLREFLNMSPPPSF